MTAKRDPHEPRLSRREALLIALGRSDQVSLERERQSAIDAARGYEPPGPSPVPPPRDAAEPNPAVLWALVVGLVLVLAGIGVLVRQKVRGGWPFSRSTPAAAR